MYVKMELEMHPVKDLTGQNKVVYSAVTHMLKSFPYRSFGFAYPDRSLGVKLCQE
jgi:hypothetical protein